MNLLLSKPLGVSRVDSALSGIGERSQQVAHRRLHRSLVDCPYYNHFADSSCGSRRLSEGSGQRRSRRRCEWPEETLHDIYYPGNASTEPFHRFG
jgi:hypothetical protein